MKQGEIYLVDLEPTTGNEQQGTRPAVIVSGNAINKKSGLCIVCPLTTKIKNYLTCLVINKNKKNKLTKNSEVLTFQIRSISKNRLKKKIGEITQEELNETLFKLGECFEY